MPELLEYWRLPEVIRRTGLGRSTIYRRIGEGTFPPPRDLGGNTAAWWAQDVVEWMLARPHMPPGPGHPPGHSGLDAGTEAPLSAA